MRENLHTLIDEIVPQMIALRKRIHRCPEPAYEEFETAAAIVGHLEKIPGMEIRRGVGKTGVVALLGREKSGPCLALRADMDCLRLQEENSFAHASQKNGLMHACGHDGHVACLVGAAMILGKLQETLPGPVKFIFQPGEENAAGAQEMIKDGVLVDPEPRAVFALHGTPSLPFGQVGLRYGPMMASSRYFSITITGRGTHAAMPHKGVDTVLAACHVVCAIHTIVSRNVNPMEAAVISIPKFEGARAPNVIPAEVHLEGTLRALSNATRDFLEKRVQDVVIKTAEAYGAEAVVEFYGGYPLLENDRKCCDYVAVTAAGVVGEENVRRNYSPSLGAEDFAFYLE
ncbi:MAG: M20 family metallopeptidase, partial [Desulfopila sp.]|nr:M20 family metallopeptidase [Desulfopila sp.]